MTKVANLGKKKVCGVISFIFYIYLYILTCLMALSRAVPLYSSRCKNMRRLDWHRGSFVVSFYAFTH